MKKLQKVLAAALVCVLALTMLTACGMTKSKHEDKLFDMIVAEADDGVTVTRSDDLDSKAKDALKSMDNAKSVETYSGNAVATKKLTDDADDTANIKKEVEALFDKLEKKVPDQEGKEPGSLKVGFAIGKVDGTEYIVMAYDITWVDAPSDESVQAVVKAE